MTQHFNLLDEPWILVRNKSGGTAQVSLTEALLRAQDYTALAGESPAQDAAILRLLIAVVYTVFYRTNEEGQPVLLEDEEKALERWSAIWQRGAFPAEPLRAYLERWHGRFDLLDKERPFYQVPKMEKGTPHTAAKLNGDILQSENKKRIFAGRAAEHSQTLPFPEAARWLVYLQGYDDASVKAQTPQGKRNLKEKPGSARGWMGNLGLLYAVGDTLFETVCLNTVFLRDGESLYGEPKPCWEAKGLRTGEYKTIAMPDDLGELFTLQGRRVLLEREEDLVTGYREYCGDLLDQKDAFVEPMTVWKKLPDKTGQGKYIPAPFSPSRQLWREFPSLAVRREGDRLPGISRWLETLQERNCLERRRMLCIASVSALYDGSGSSVKNTVSDTLSFHMDLLTEAGYIWQRRIEKEISVCNELAGALGVLAGELALAAGKREFDKEKPRKPVDMTPAKAAKSQFYFRIDGAFREWLLRPQAGQEPEEREKICDEWRSTAEQIVRRQGRELVDEAGQAAFIGRQIEKRHYSSAEAYNRFSWKIGRILGKEPRKEREHDGNR